MNSSRLLDLTKQSDLSSSLVISFDEWLNKLPKMRCNYLIPVDFSRETGVSLKEANEVFRIAKESSLLSSVYQIYCPECEQLVDEVKRASVLKKEFTCFNNHTFIPNENYYYVKEFYRLIDR